MPSLRRKLAVGIITSAVVASAVWLAVRRMQRAEPAETYRAHFADQPAPPLAIATPVAGVHPFEATQPVFPPSTFRRWPLTPEEVRNLLVARDEFVEYDPFDYFRYLPLIDKEVPMPEHPLGKWRLQIGRAHV